jgi:hypothetical protein
MAMLSTSDNPYDPFTQWDEWYSWDLSHGYNTPSYLARMVVSSNDLSDADQALAIDLAIDEIVSENVSGVYIKVEKKKENEK